MPWSTGGQSKSPMPPEIWLLREHRHTRQPTSPLRSSGLDRLQVRRAKQATPLHQKSLAAKLFVQSCRGCPRVRAPVGFQSNTRLTHRFAGKFATCIANFQWCLRHCSDQAFNPCCCASATGLPFQWCRISCQGAFHSTILGGPTIIRSILRKTTSSSYKSPIRIVRWPEAKKTTGVMTRSMKRSRTAKRTFLSQRICLLAKNALEAG